MTTVDTPVPDEKYPEIAALIEKYNLTCDFKFVPFSVSRNKAEKNHSLNWIYTLKRNDREILSGDYMQGSGHAPAHSRNFKIKPDKPIAVRGECETGKIHIENPFSSGSLPHETSKHIPVPLIRDILYALMIDASVLDSGSFESWAGDLGYDTDSRTAEKIYSLCVQTALKLRGSLGAEGVTEFQTAFQDY